MLRVNLHRKTIPRKNGEEIETLKRTQLIQICIYPNIRALIILHYDGPSGTIKKKKSDNK